MLSGSAAIAVIYVSYVRVRASNRQKGRKINCEKVKFEAIFNWIYRTKAHTYAGNALRSFLSLPATPSHIITSRPHRSRLNELSLSQGSDESAFLLLIVVVVM